MVLLDEFEDRARRIHNCLTNRSKQCNSAFRSIAVAVLRIPDSSCRFLLVVGIDRPNMAAVRKPSNSLSTELIEDKGHRVVRRHFGSSSGVAGRIRHLSWMCGVGTPPSECGFPY